MTSRCTPVQQPAAWLGLGLWLSLVCSAFVLSLPTIIAAAQAQTSTTEPRPPAALPVRIAVPAPTRAPYAALGDQVHQAAVRAAAHLSSTDVAGYDVSLAIEIVRVPDPCTSGAAAAAGEAVAAGAFDAVIGFPCRATALGAAPAFAKSGQLLITTAPLVPPYGLTQVGPTVFRAPVAESSLGAFLGASIAGAAPEAARIALVRDRTQLSITLAQAVEASLASRGRQLAATELFAGGDKAFATMAARLKAQGVTHVALIAFAVEGALIARALAAEIPDVMLYGPDHLATADVLQLAGDASAHLRVVLPARDPLGVLAAHPRLGQALAEAPSREALAVAAAIEAYASAVRRTRSTDARLVATTLRAPGSTGAVGAAFDARGAMVVPYWALWRWHDGILVETR